MRLLTLILFSSFLASCGVISGDSLPDIPGRLVFSSAAETGNGEIHVMNADGSSLKQRTEIGGYGPSWSWDGREVIFYSFESGGPHYPAMWVVGDDGSDQRVLYKPESSPLTLGGEYPRWSPDGTKVAYVSFATYRSNYEVYVFDTDDISQSMRMTNHPGNDILPFWSPDGNRILFASERDDSVNLTHSLYVTDLDQTKLKLVDSKNLLGTYDWITSNKIMYYESSGYDWRTKNIFTLDLETGIRDTLVSKITSRVFWALWDYHSQQLLTINKNEDFSLVTISLYDDQGQLLEEYETDQPEILKGVGFDWTTR